MSQSMTNQSMFIASQGLCPFPPPTATNSEHWCPVLWEDPHSWQLRSLKPPCPGARATVTVGFVPRPLCCLQSVIVLGNGLSFTDSHTPCLCNRRPGV